MQKCNRKNFLAYFGPEGAVLKAQKHYPFFSTFERLLQVQMTRTIYKSWITVRFFKKKIV